MSATSTTSVSNTAATEQIASAHGEHHILPLLGANSSFWAMAATQFLGAFNDNLFKQLILLLATPTARQLREGSGEDLQSNAQFVFAAAFLIFSGFAGYLSDRYSKSVLTVLCKVAECFIMLAGMIGFFYFDRIGVNGMFVVLFFMGMHSAFFGPVKYGVLPELVRPIDLPRANGIFLMLTFLAIIFGVALAGALLLLFATNVWMASFACIGVAILGTITAIGVRRLPPAQPDLHYDWSCWLVPRDTMKLIRRDRQLLWAMIVVAIFWMVGGIALQTVNALGKSQLGLDEMRTSSLAAAIGIGTAIGCILGGYLSRGRVNRTVVTTGAFGTIASLALLSLPGGPAGQLLGYWGSLPVLILLGTFSGMFIVPVQVALQSRPPKEEKGRVIATMNQLSWIGVILGAIVYKLSLAALVEANAPRSLIFGITALLMPPVALLYRPKDEQLPTETVD
jgi:acyl-[acyl-carrier-protein]-phospholipid O-acyltransferase/long-chain-fatty-acid--[acyl-carrier-protein] ligase